jgi:CheY-like chemotaxis protein
MYSEEDASCAAADATIRLRIEAATVEIGRNDVQPLEKVQVERKSGVDGLGPITWAEDLENWRDVSVCEVGVMEPSADARSQALAGMNPELRSELHEILGFAQLLHMNGGLDPAQTRWVDAIVAAGTRLLMQVQNAIGLTDLGPEPPAAPKYGDGDIVGVSAFELSTEQIDAHPMASPMSGLHVLVVDDVEMNRDIAAAFLRRAGHLVTLCDGGEASVAAAAEADFDVILMDVRMPEIDGLEACRRIRALPGVRGRVSIIALTVQTSGEQLEACRAAGMNGHLAKPFRYDILNAAILRATAEHAAQRCIKSATATMPALAAPFHRPAVQHGAQIDITRALERRRDSRDVNFAATYLRSAREMVSDEHGAPPATCRQNVAAIGNGATTSPAWMDIADPWNISVPNGPATAALRPQIEPDGARLGLSACQQSFRAGLRWLRCDPRGLPKDMALPGP